MGSVNIFLILIDKIKSIFSPIQILFHQENQIEELYTIAGRVRFLFELQQSKLCTFRNRGKSKNKSNLTIFFMTTGSNIKDQWNYQLNTCIDTQKSLLIT